VTVSASVRAGRAAGLRLTARHGQGVGASRQRSSLSAAIEHIGRARVGVYCHAQLVEVRLNAAPVGSATIELSADEVRALFNILSFVAAGGSLTEKPERDMAARLRADLQKALSG
jgi:hypothetical protein